MTFSFFRSDCSLFSPSTTNFLVDNCKKIFTKTSLLALDATAFVLPCYSEPARHRVSTQKFRIRRTGPLARLQTLLAVQLLLLSPESSADYDLISLRLQLFQFGVSAELLFGR